MINTERLSSYKQDEAEEMMHDLEALVRRIGMLKSAARAAGYVHRVVVDGLQVQRKIRDVGENSSSWVYWDPVNDNGDALELAVDVQLVIDTASCGLGMTSVYTSIAGLQDFCEEHGDDRMEATRLAIVRAASEVGKTMPEKSPLDAPAGCQDREQVVVVPKAPKAPKAKKAKKARDKRGASQSSFHDLPDHAYARQSQLIQNPSRPGSPAPLPFSSATLWRMVRLGEFPKPIKLAPRVTAWRVGDVRNWLKKQSGR